VTAERLQKVLARAGVAARRKAEELIREGRVTVNGKVATIGDKADPARDAIKVDDKRIHPPREHRYLLLNKPKGYLTAIEDTAGRPTVVELVPPQLRRALVPVGRLDFQTEGLLLLTDDGDFAQRIAHPRYGCHKTYEVKVHGLPTDVQLEKLRRGVVLDGKRTSPCRIDFLRRTGSGPEDGNTWYHVELAEGRTRQIREMFFRAGHPVQKLRRVAIGPLRDLALPVGAWRELSEREIASLRRATDRVKPRSAPRPRGGRDPRPARDAEAPIGRARIARRPAAGKRPKPGPRARSSR
jgi:23S rRNA pseudouridine2605 synthase